MHELSIARSLVEQAVDAAADHGAERIDRLELEIGEATHLNPDQLTFCVETVAAETPAAEADIAVTSVSPEGVCDCGWSGRPAEIQDLPMAVPDLRCPECDSRLELTAGTECRLARISVPETDDTT
ncbi:hydrogenase nickel incorporation protein HypA/HybF [Halovenus aranensis]|uniref:Hydrogenase maturation factor HypA n=1 Tax=Halovenus aranensis TaxID=890420 RepID=A0A1G8VDU3_9EURY|nr:hydrogenase maturation nickel metallochaperone HypA [Halovenus aranensis]SDJ64129.1 hydrogenase nickel incorporation protein HypA/HybF [Halovenus aranensis]